jgi:hypothetical protein
MTHMIFRNGMKPLDLDAVILDGIPARSWSRDALENRLRQLGVNISIGAGRDSMVVALHQWQQNTDGPEAA